jgi:lipopolysaccharide export system protein LptA
MTRPRRGLLTCLLLAPLLLAGTLLAGVARSQGIDLSQGGPIDVTATNGIEWRQTEQVIIATGEARAIRGGVTVNADRLIARYRPVPPAAGEKPVQQASATPGTGATSGGANEIWRLEAEGHVVIRTATDTARGDRAVYDIDKAVMVLTGSDLSLVTPSQNITAKDSLEYWSQTRMAVARGNAKVTEPAENRQITGDTVVAYFLETSQGGAPKPAAPPGEKAPPGAGRIDRVEAFGNVEIRTATDVVRGDRGVYSAQTGMARLLGAVRITRGDNQINGREAIVNMRTGVARLVSTPGERVQGLIVPKGEDAATPSGTPTPNNPAAGGKPAGGKPTGQTR